MTLLAAAQNTSIASIAGIGNVASARENRRATGSSAPVTTRPRPTIINAMIVTNASWPKPRKKVFGLSGPVGVA